jgi:NTP pyrophosphatase (non-canonical NTP hydrolase)
VLVTAETENQLKNNLLCVGAQIIFVALMKNLIAQAHGTAKEKGFWDTERNVSEMLMLIVSELAEAQEALRKDYRCDSIAANELRRDLELDSSDEEFLLHTLEWKHKFEEAVKSSFEDEVADVAIRLFDLCGGLGIDLEKHIELKMKYNSLRGYKHGKKF